MTEFIAKIWADIWKPLSLLGFAGQFVFFLRFAVQWIATEKRKEVVVPEAFWWFSICGGAITFVYGILIHQPPIYCAQILVLPIYSRNLVILKRTKKRLSLDVKAD